MKITQAQYDRLTSGKAPRPHSDEAGVLSACLSYLHAKGVFAWRTNNQGTFDPVKKIRRKFTGLKGVSDILGMHNGTLLAIEVKDKGALTLDQRHFLERVKALGGLAIVARSIDDLKEVGL